MEPIKDIIKRTKGKTRIVEDAAWYKGHYLVSPLASRLQARAIERGGDQLPNRRECKLILNEFDNLRNALEDQMEDSDEDEQHKEHNQRLLDRIKTIDMCKERYLPN